MLFAAGTSASIPARVSSSLTPELMRAIRSPPPSFSCSIRLVIDSYASGSSSRKASVCISLHELIHADPLGKRGVDIHRFAAMRRRFSSFLMKCSVRILCSRSASLTSSTRNVIRHGEQELAQVFGRALVLGHRLDLGELGDAIDQPRDIGAEAARSMSSSCVASVSSMVSCSSAVTIVSSSSSARSGCPPLRSDG
jgi:hypothetical protein